MTTEIQAQIDRQAKAIAEALRAEKKHTHMEDGVYVREQPRRRKRRTSSWICARAWRDVREAFELTHAEGRVY